MGLLRQAPSFLPTCPSSHEVTEERTTTSCLRQQLHTLVIKQLCSCATNTRLTHSSDTRRCMSVIWRPACRCLLTASTSGLGDSQIHRLRGELLIHTHSCCGMASSTFCIHARTLAQMEDGERSEVFALKFQPHYRQITKVPASRWLESGTSMVTARTSALGGTFTHLLPQYMLGCTWRSSE